MKYDILIVEDDPMVRTLNGQYLAKIINPDEFNLTSVDNADDALTVLKSDSIDLILLDVYMPKMSGDKLLNHLTTLNIHPQVIMLTAASDSTQVTNALNYGVLDYLVKPFTFIRFKTAIEKFLSFTEFTTNHDKYSQNQLDHLFINQNVKESSAELPKGLSPYSLDKIKRAVQSFDAPFSNQDVAQKVKLSRISTKKYLDYLLASGELSTTIKYLKVGRPITLYQLHTN